MQCKGKTQKTRRRMSDSLLQKNSKNSFRPFSNSSFFIFLSELKLDGCELGLYKT
jgi:hypothetical protein